MSEFALAVAAFVASHTSRRTWLCHHVYRPLARACMCSCWEHDAVSRFRHRARTWRFPPNPISANCPWRATDLIAKASRSGDIFHKSVQVRDRCITSSQVVHLPCYDCITAFVTRSCSTFLLLSWLIREALTDVNVNVVHLYNCTYSEALLVNRL